MKGSMRFVPETPLPMHHHAAVHLPLCGPFITTGQHDTRFEGLDWDEALATAEREGKASMRLDPKWGEVSYQRSETGRVEVAAYYTDSSD